MIRQDGSTVRDAAEIGRALAFPGSLRTQLATLAADHLPVQMAARRGWSGLEQLRLDTAALNGSIATARGTVWRRAPGLEAAGPSSENGTVPDGKTHSRGLGVEGITADAVAAIEAVLPAAGAARTARAAVSFGEARGRASLPVDRSVITVKMTQSGSTLRQGRPSAGVSGPDIAREHIAQTDAGSPSAPGASAYQSATVRDDRDLAPSPSRETALTWPDRGDAAAIIRATAPLGRLRADVDTALRSRTEPGLSAGALDGFWIGADVPGRAVMSGRGDRGRARPTEDDGAGQDLDRAGVTTRRAGLDATGPESGGNGTGGGVVMLDGRLVGQWLSERMARDAARPGAGATFFDPRQSPAWTPSGAL